MVKHIFAIKDELVGFNNIVIEENSDVAIRGFSSSVLNLKEQMSSFIDDYSLYEVGTFNLLSGAITPCEPRLITTASRVIREHAYKDVKKEVVEND